MAKMTEEEFVQLVLKDEPPDTKVVKVVKGDHTYLKFNDLNIDLAARLLKDLIK
ncbi:hypothetical protein [Lysinibacillus sphaericus]|uniref:hypothetical protein n=1 Tax=Lysinibacillus sphaericus TaxID=1421 RepID=UPI0003A4515E|nr:hypothetical protein [Lysinibacillus sphaericus]